MTERALTQLVNDERVRVAVRKLFSGDTSQIAGELLQNAQRAGARRVEFATSMSGLDGATENKVWVRDDGSGVVNEIAGWHAMLSIADSSYQDQNVRMQEPLGLGLHSLFACPRVYAVTLRSGGRMIEIDTARWWEDKEYYSTWAQRLTGDRKMPEKGLELEIACEKKFVEAVIQALRAKEDVYRSSPQLPARGYEGVLEISLDGEPVDTSVLSRFIHSDSALIWEGEYLGNGLKIGHGPRSCVNWYGQAIEDALLNGGFSYYLEVRRGTPLDLKSPTREGVIGNGKREALRQFLVDRIFEAVNGVSIDRLKLDWVRGLYQLDPERAGQEGKYYIAGKITNAAATAFSSNEEFEQLEEEIKAYDRGEVLLLESGVTVEYQDGGEKRQLVDQRGIETFVEDLRRVYGEPYQLVVGERERLRIRELVWSPRKMAKSIFADAGVFTLREEGVAPQEWHPVAGDVFAFDSPSASHILNAEPLVAPKDPDLWLRSNSPWALFDPDGAEDSYETCRQSFEESITETMMAEFPDTIAEPFSLLDLSGRLGEGRITKIDIVWSEKERPLLRVTNERGQEKELQVI